MISFVLQHPFVSTLLVYIFGTCAVGFPIGHFSLWVWKNYRRSDWKYKVLSYVLFPWRTLMDKVGIISGIDGNGVPLMSSLNITEDVLTTDSEEHLHLRAKYILTVSVFWPMRICLFIIGHVWSCICILYYAFIEGIDRMARFVVKTCTRCLMLR